MRLVSMTVENFRCYRNPMTISINDFTTVIGRNDVGKSTLMDALAIFFETASLDRDDACKHGDPKNIRITCEFDELPASLVVDTDFPTTLADEFLLSAQNTLIIQKIYNGSLATPKLLSVSAIAKHPTADGLSDLLSLKRADLVKRCNQLAIDISNIDKRANAPLRKALWSTAGSLELRETAIPLDEEGGKHIWTALGGYMPTFALFKSDRESTDQDAEAQDPLKAAIREAIKEVEPILQQVRDHVENETRKIAERTIEKIREMDPSIANTLDPVISTRKWDSLFSTSITGDNGIPLNKRGSGVKRLILLNFFRAKAEKEAAERNSPSVIYAIEEPETSQHPRNQRLLLGALQELSGSGNKQIILTTHTPMLARYLPESSFRFLTTDTEGRRTILNGGPATTVQIALSLGVLADHNVKLFIAVEGTHDISFLKAISGVLAAEGEKVPDLAQLELDGQIVFFPLGGAILRCGPPGYLH